MSNELTIAKQALSTALVGAKAFQIVTAEDHAFACQQLITVKTNAKHFKEQKETATKPLNAGLKAVRDMFRPIETDLEQMETCLKQKIGEYEQRKKQEETAALAKAAALFQTGDHAQGLVALNAVPDVAVVKQQGVSTRTVVKFRILNPELVPREYCAPVEALIRARVGVSGLQTSIPGVEVYEDVMVVGRV